VECGASFASAITFSHFYNRWGTDSFGLCDKKISFWLPLHHTFRELIDGKQTSIRPVLYTFPVNYTVCLNTVSTLSFISLFSQVDLYFEERFQSHLVVIEKEGTRQCRYSFDLALPLGVNLEEMGKGESGVLPLKEYFLFSQDCQSVLDPEKQLAEQVYSSLSFPFFSFHCGLNFYHHFKRASKREK